jgi:hypothetical protein
MTKGIALGCIGSNPSMTIQIYKRRYNMNNFLETLKSQFIEDKNVSLISSCDTLEEFLNSDSEIIMCVYKESETSDIISIEFTGI